MKMDRVQSNFTKILRSTVLVILGMVLGTYIYIMVIENYEHENVYPQILDLDDDTLRRVGVNQYHVDPDQVHDVQFPYSKFNRFGMRWIGIVEEYEWSYNHLKREHLYTQGYEALKLGPDSITPTSVSKSKVYLQDKKSTFMRGEFIHVIVETRDDYGNQRLRGGDFLTGVMFNKEMQASTAARMIDYGNGTYSMYFYAGWKGQAAIDVSLSFTREAILFFDLTRFRDRRTLWSANFTNGKVIETSNCTSTNEGTWENKCSYINPWSLGKTAMLCHKPKSLPCSTLTNISQNLHQMVTMAEQDVKDMRYLFERQVLSNISET
ncbi:NXPE family member 4-like [Ptychodera flava]|uniref:NXPE family member 4-like n=1 Tax=Ptychodera flava TaxID=63121 RepID=UPI003969D491